MSVKVQIYEISSIKKKALNIPIGINIFNICNSPQYENGFLFSENFEELTSFILFFKNPQEQIITIQSDLTLQEKTFIQPWVNLHIKA